MQGVRVHPFEAHLRARARRHGVAGAALRTAVALAVGGCSSSGSSAPAAQSSGASGTASGDASPMASKVVLGKVAGNVHQPFRDRFAAVRQHLEASVGQAVDAWLDGGFVGVSYPRDTFDAAFATFTPDARKDAERDKAASPPPTAPSSSTCSPRAAARPLPLRGSTCGSPPAATWPRRSR